MFGKRTLGNPYLLMIRILYVDDEPALLEIGKTYLERSGDMDIRTVSSANLALEEMSKESFDAIISDYQMPGMDGIALLKEVRARGNPIPFIIFTGKGREEIVIQALNEGADHYLQKGGEQRAQFAELEHIIRQEVYRKRTDAELVRSEEKFSRFFHANPNLMVIGHPETGRIINANTAFTSSTGYTMDELIGKTSLELGLFVNPEERERMADIMRDHGVIRDHEVAVRIKNGQVRNFLFFSDIIRVDGEELIFSQAVDITERRRMEEALRVSEEKYRKLVETSPDSIVMYDLSGIILAANQKSAEVYGSESPDQFISDAANVFRLLDESNKRKAEESFRRTLDAGYSETTEYQINRKDGSSFPAEVSSSIVTGPDGTPAAFISVVRDITERRMAEKARNESEQRLKTIFESTTDSIFIKDLHRRYQLVNPAMERLFGLTADELIGKSDRELFGEDADRNIRQADERVFAGETINTENTKPVLGKPVIFNVIKAPVHDAAGDIIGLCGIARDVTANRKLVDELGENEKKFRALIENMDGIVFTIRSDGIITYVSPAIRRIIGYEQDEVVGSPFSRFIHPEDLSRVTEDFRERLTGIPRTTEYRLTARDGRAVWVRSYSHITGDGMDPDGISGILVDINEKKANELALKESEEKYRTLVEQSNDGIFIQKGDRLRFMNRKGLEMTGYEADEIPDLPTWTLIHPFDREKVRNLAYARSRGEDVPSTYTARVVTKQGEIKEAEFSVSRIDVSGEPASQGIVRDVTERKRTERALQESEEKYRILIERTQDGVFIVQEGVFVFVNRAFMKMLGYQEHEIIGKPVGDLIAPEDREMVISRYNARLAGLPVPDSYEVRGLHRDGKKRLILKMYVEIGHFRGKVATIGTIRDVTREREESEALKESEERYRRLLSQSFDAVVIHQDGKVVVANRTAARIIGADSEDNLIGRAVMDFVHPDSRKVVRERVGVMQSSPDTAVPLIEERFLGLDGNPIDVEVMATAFTYMSRPAVQVVFRDISERKKAETALKEVNRKLNLLSGITWHDIFNQVTVADGFIEIARERIPDSETNGLLEKAGDALRNIREQVNFTREYESIGMKEPAWVNVREVIRKASKGLDLSGMILSIDTEGLEIYADTLIERVFFNLMDNSLNHGGGIRSISISYRPGTETGVLVYEDDGAGIPDTEKNAIFARGFGKNTGLGLFMVTEILGITGIGISETGIQGIGARFELSIPKGGYRVIPPAGQ